MFTEVCRNNCGKSQRIARSLSEFCKKAREVNRVSAALKELDTTISPQDKMSTCQAAYNACVGAIDDLMKTKRHI